jgi:hypothetical protein
MEVSMSRPLVLLFALAGVAAAAEPRKLTGCVDEQEGPVYVLRGDRVLRPLAKLEPVGFDVENFARYLGKKITVTGDYGPKSQLPVFRVRSVEVVSEQCAPVPLAGAKASAGETPAGAARTAPAPSKKPGEFTGCVDELPGPKYVLRSDDGLRIVAQLETAGFNPEDLFARHLGHKVTVRGKVDSSGEVPVVTLTSAAALKMIANRCAPE